MISDAAKREIDALSTHDLRIEINKKHRSRFQGDNYAYLEARLATLDEDQRRQQHLRAAAYKDEELTLARDANKISRDANALSRIALITSVVAALIALGALLKDMSLFR